MPRTSPLRFDLMKRSFRNNLKMVIWNDLFNMVSNAIEIINKPEDVPERWIKNLIFKNGEMAVWENMVLEICGNNGYYVYDQPTELLLRSPNRERTFFVPTKELAWIGANQTRTGVCGYIDLQTDKMVELEISLMQNIIASRSGDLLGIGDKNLQLTIEQAILQNTLGAPYIVVDKKLLDEENLKQIKLSVSFMADKINQLLQEVRNETLAHFGILNASTNKRERVQVGELEAAGDYAYDNIYTIIDTLNRDAEEGGIEMRFKFNGALDDFTPNREEPETENETGQEPGESEEENND